MTPPITANQTAGAPARRGADLLRASAPFLDWLGGWYDRLPTVALTGIVRDPARIALISVDMVNGFCYEGPLSGPRVAGIVAPIVALLQASHAAGLRRTVAPFLALPFAGEFTVVGKNSISGSLGTSLPAWLDAPAQRAVDTFLVVGDCTDLCTYQTAMYLKLRANAANRSVRVVVPEDCVQTYDLAVPVAAQIGALPHSGDLHHLVFLYHLALNGCEVVRHIAPVAG